MREKAAQGTYPGRAPFGYRNNRLERTIEVHPTNAEIVTRIFELNASGQYSLSELRKAVQNATGKTISRAYLHTILTSRFYVGQFLWGGRSRRVISSSGTSPRSSSGRQQDFRTGEQSLFSIPYAHSDRAGRITSISAFELCRGWRKSPHYLQKALRPDLSKGRK
jgi:hypothetical protein